MSPQRFKSSVIMDVNPDICSVDGDVPSPTPSELDAFNEVTNRTEVFDLPPPLQPCQSIEKPRPQLAVIGRKRTIEESMNPSSDLPMFSSDDLSASLENYSSQNQKRQHVRRWWDDRRISLSTEAELGSLQAKRSPFTRNDDSGIWMNSDGAESITDDVTGCSSMILPNEETSIGIQCAKDIGMGGGNLKSIVPPYWRRQPEDQVVFHASQAQVSETIQKAADAEARIIDLSNMDLDIILSSTLRPLHLLTRQLADCTSPDEVAFKPLDVELGLILTNNKLQSLPGEAYKLANLTTLSARNNQLTDISPSIANLQKLQELNLSVNELRYLPYEILELCKVKLTGLRIQSNPFLEPYFGSWNYSESFLSDDAFMEWLHAKGPTLRARSTVAYFDAFGNICRGSCPAPSRTQEYLYPPDTPWSPSSLKSHHLTTRVPSLAELSLRACQGFGFLEDFAANSASEELFPESIIPLLQEAWTTQDAGGKLCSVCKRSYVIPRTEWLEWWSHFTTLNPMVKPFIRRGCSWACIPDLEALSEEWRNCGWGFLGSRGKNSSHVQPPGSTDDPPRTNIPGIWPAFVRELRLNFGTRGENGA